MANKGFKTIFWGLLITFVDFRIIGFNLIPDFVGFVVIASGLAHLTNWHPKFSIAKSLATVMVVVALPDLVEIVSPYFPANTVNPLWPILAIGGVINLVMTWFLLKGIIELATKSGKVSLADSARAALNLFIAIEITGLVLSSSISLLISFLFVFPYLMVFLMILPLVTIIGLIVSMVILYVVYKASEELSFDSESSFETGMPRASRSNLVACIWGYSGSDIHKIL